MSRVSDSSLAPPRARRSARTRVELPGIIELIVPPRFCSAQDLQSDHGHQTAQERAPFCASYYLTTEIRRGRVIGEIQPRAVPVFGKRGDGPVGFGRLLQRMTIKVVTHAQVAFYEDLVLVWSSLGLSHAFVVGPRLLLVPTEVQDGVVAVLRSVSNTKTMSLYKIH